MTDYYNNHDNSDYEDEDVFGIHLGQNTLSIGIWRNGKPEIILNELGETKIPYYISFTKSNILIGTNAKDNMRKNSKNTIYGMNKLIGRKFNDPIVQELIKSVSYKIEKDELEDKPKIAVEYFGTIKRFYPEEIYSIFIKKIISKYNINKAVIVLPLYINYLQKNIIKKEFKKIGLNEIKIINEPYSACIAYNFQKKGEKNILIYSLNSSELNITILNINNSSSEIVATRRDEYLGGNNFTEELMKFCIKEIKENTGININDNENKLRKLKYECEKIKICLSSLKEVSIDFDIIGVDYKLEISLPEFEEMCEDLFNKCISILEKTLIDSGLSKFEIDEIIFAGGATYMFPLKRLIYNFFEGTSKLKFHQLIEPKEVYVYGATTEASILYNIIDIDLCECIELSLGIDKGDGIMEFVIPKYAFPPFKKVLKFTELNHSKSVFNYKIYQGERKLVKYNELLGECSIINVNKEKREIHIEITFVITNKILSVNLKEEGENNENITKITLNNHKDGKEIKKLIEEGKKYEKMDEIEIEKIKKEKKSDGDDEEETMEILKKKNMELIKKNDESEEEIKILKKKLNDYENEKKKSEDKFRRMNNEYIEMKKNYAAVIEQKKKLEMSLMAHKK